MKTEKDPAGQRPMHPGRPNKTPRISQCFESEFAEEEASSRISGDPPRDNRARNETGPSKKISESSTTAAACVPEYSGKITAVQAQLRALE